MSTSKMGNRPGMKLFHRAIFVIFIIDFFTPALYGQPDTSVMVHIEMKKESLQVLIERLKAQVDLSFISAVKTEEVNGIDFPNAVRTVKQVLDLMAAQTGLTYRIKRNTVFIYDRVDHPKPGRHSSPSLNVSGEVTESATQQPLPGVSILIKGTTNGTTTDTYGQYSIEAAKDDVLVFSFIGHKTIEASFNGQPVLNVSMEEEVAKLNEVVVNGGYYRTTDRLKTGNIVKITAKEIENQPVTSPLLALQGRVPGLEITPQNGAPGSAPTIRIRGDNSLRRGAFGRSNGNYPLYIVDGVPISSVPVQSVSFSFMQQGFDPLSTLSPDNIESIEILKDADATAIYGSRGANGVILITTKQGKNSSKTNFDVSFYNGVGHISKKVNMMNTRQYLAMRHEAIRNDGISIKSISAPDLTLWDTTRYTDWQNKLLGNSAHIYDFQGTLSGGGTRTSFRLAAGYHKESMIFPGDFWFDRGTLSMNVNHTSQNDKFGAAVSINLGTNNNRLFDDADFVNNAIFLPPNAPEIYDDNGELNWAIDPLTGRSSWNNPFSLIKKINKSRTFNVIVNGTMDYELLPGLTLKTSIGISELNSHESSINPLSSRSPTSDQTVALSYFGQNNRRGWTIEPQLSYQRNIERHNLDLIIGSTIQQNIFEFQRVEGAYPSDEFVDNLQAASSIRYVVDDNSVYRFTSIFTRLGYNLDKKYFINLSGRRDGSSRFGPGNRFGDFGSVGVAWIFSNERMFKDNIRFVSLGKLRGSFGLTGNDQIGDYQYYDSYVVGTGYDGKAGLYPAALYNPEFAWEKTKKLEIALQLGLLDDRIKLEASWYRHRSANQLVNYPLSAITGFPSVLKNFDAIVQNTGIEMMLTSTPIATTSLNWSISVNFTMPHNKLVQFNGIEDSPYQYTYQVGQPLSVQRFWRWEGVDPKTGIHSFYDQNNDGVIDDLDKVFMDVLRRKWYGGVMNSISYKRFEMSFLFQVVKQDSRKYAQTLPGTPSNQPTAMLDRWQYEGDQTSVAKFSQDIRPNNYYPYVHYIQSQGVITNGSFVRLKTVSAAFRLPNKGLKQLRLENLKIFIQGQNLLTFTSLKNLDPETGTSLPPLRMLTIGLNIGI